MLMINLKAEQGMLYSILTSSTLSRRHEIPRISSSFGVVLAPEMRQVLLLITFYNPGSMQCLV